MKIYFYNRMTNSLELEKIYGDKLIKWLYFSRIGRFISWFLCFAPFSKFYGLIQDSSFSQKKILPFIKNFQISMDDYLPQDPEDKEFPFKNFNQFFIRKFKAGKRNFEEDNHQMAAFSEARYLGFDSVLSDHLVPVKGFLLKLDELIQNPLWNQTFIDGPLLLARLCPVDYHRFHYPDDGVILDSFRISGKLHSVNPIALKMKPDILFTNERQVTILESKNFGKLAYIEVGAICVGKIVQTQSLISGRSFKRGEEKGYFLFGGSTVIVIGEKGKWRPACDILEHTQKGIETYLHLGTSVATVLF